MADFYAGLGIAAALIGLGVCRVLWAKANEILARIRSPTRDQNADAK